MTFRLLFAYTLLVFLLPSSRVHDFTICCKGCGANIPAPVETMPSSWIVTQCPLCGTSAGICPATFSGGGCQAAHQRSGTESRALMGLMKRAIAREEQERARAMDEQKHMMDRLASTLVIAASIIAAVRLAREDISRPSPRLTAVVTDSVSLARMILESVVR